MFKHKLNVREKTADTADDMGLSINEKIVKLKAAGAIRKQAVRKAGRKILNMCKKGLTEIPYEKMVVDITEVDLSCNYI